MKAAQLIKPDSTGRRVLVQQINMMRCERELDHAAVSMRRYLETLKGRLPSNSEEGCQHA